MHAILKTHTLYQLASKTFPKTNYALQLVMEWSSNFTILGFEIDNKLKNLGKNYFRVFDKIKGIIKSWTPYKLSLKGRLTIAKTLLVSQPTYISTVLTPNEKKLEEIQNHKNNFVQDIPLTKKNWINSHQVYTPPKNGGMGMIKLDDFIQGIKVSWIS